MSLSPAPLTSHGLGFATWHVYDPSCKAELWSTAYFGNELTVLFDPINWPKNTPLPPGVVQIVRTNANHDRNCQALLHPLSAHLSTHPPGFHPLPLPGGGEGEIAYFHERTSTLVVGDSLINLAPHGLTLLPEKYCTDLSMLKISIKRLLDLPIQRIFFAHGAPILHDALTKLRQLPL